MTILTIPMVFSLVGPGVKMSQEVTGGALPSPQDLGFRLDHPRNQQNHKRMTYIIYMGAVRKSRSQIYELMRLLCFARLLKPASR